MTITMCCIVSDEFRILFKWTVIVINVVNYFSTTDRYKVWYESKANVLQITVDFQRDCLFLCDIL